MDQILVTVEAAARLLSIGRSLCYELIASGQLPRVKVGRRTLVPVSALHEWVDRKLLADRLASESAKQAERPANQARTRGLGIPLREVG